MPPTTEALKRYMGSYRSFLERYPKKKFHVEELDPVVRCLRHGGEQAASVLGESLLGLGLGGSRRLGLHGPHSDVDYFLLIRDAGRQQRLSVAQAANSAINCALTNAGFNPCVDTIGDPQNAFFVPEETSYCPDEVMTIFPFSYFLIRGDQTTLYDEVMRHHAAFAAKFPALVRDFHDLLNSTYAGFLGLFPEYVAKKHLSNHGTAILGPDQVRELSLSPSFMQEMAILALPATEERANRYPLPKELAS